ncbi:2-oxo-4-hydroxy-4-carboxy-5-ureidoimidazoline decarboxylase [Nesterenkonia sp. NBAIMH1]|uniref:2-oxo-4-hydroxy-4-carboxy-5-ureidoimidazoline decarboxylase n=1 Tax=Nesterenkonia sp. NBAIMH1 TaxID=2600320 RepID=UPI0011B53C9E|nr:2-oxo-4-hydroxy-4-carboxy-5-ureidoimidazoline decarboxylase [Nesterenkonia sp. NBAIMH1]
MRLSEFNDASADQAGEVLSTCAPVASWRAGLLARRPYASFDELSRTAADLAEGWTDQEVDAALAHHPRIGEKVSGDDAEAAASRREQGELTADEQARIDWIEANRQYEARFDRIFLIRAKGRSSEEMLEHLQRRLSHDAETENEVRRQQLAEIALLRLEESLRS